jgi:hypothetical protein
MSIGFSGFGCSGIIIQQGHIIITIRGTIPLLLFYLNRVWLCRGRPWHIHPTIISIYTIARFF